jgi:hypothetical protein
MLIYPRQSQASISSNILRSSSALGTTKLFTDFEVVEDTVSRTGQRKGRNPGFIRDAGM